MNILMLTNTFTPHVGGVARSVAETTRQMERLGHKVMIVCPSFEGTESTRKVLRVPAIEQFRDTSFSFPLPIPSGVHRAIDEFRPDVVHSHHPFLLGDTALRVGAERDIPVVFTHHTQYDKYAHYLGGENSTMGKRFINELDIGYCNLCDAVIAPSQSVVDDLVARGVTRHMEVIPTGIDPSWWSVGSREFFRREHGLSESAFVIGHVGRLAIEKNLPFLAESVARFLATRPDAWFVVAGQGPCEADILMACERHGVTDRLLTFGVLDPVQLRDLYRSLDVFVFASKSETQGIVLAEAMAAGIPVVALDACGVREIVEDKINGRMLAAEDVNQFSDAIAWVANLNANEQTMMHREVMATAERYSLERTTRSLLKLYQWVAKVNKVNHSNEHQSWNAAVNRIEEETKIWSNFAHAIGEAVAGSLRGRVIG
ncbi:Alpha-monoglucosyldiacylglycerol synthase [Stieleria bergensis]|uniref:Alpha-monoglucosyldiacylglycerol synthase n=1 Tax=Stieleria bergensis TaxID=2528025 RepID=A0A517SYZ4_9BACT|nr:Alpha-monoglucosyldiacylglycerol synthase [Planctomycetes bacterium SV_7m_r]